MPIISVFSTDQVRQLDAAANAAGLGQTLMRVAGEALCAKVLELLRQGSLESPVMLRPNRRTKWPEGWRTRSVLIFAGRGNNGGDGVALAAQLSEQKQPYDLILLHPAEEFRGEAKTIWESYQASGGQATVLTSLESLSKMPSDRYGLIVDAMTGSGLKGPLQGLAVDVAKWIADQRFPVLSVDAPSGASALEEHPTAPHVVADWTLLMGFARMEGTREIPGEAYGQWTVAPLPYPQNLVQQFQDENSVLCITPSCLKDRLPPRHPWGDKRAQGVLCVVAGSRGMTGSAALCSQTALRAGAGMVHLACPTAELPTLGACLKEVVLHPQDSANGSFLASALSGILRLLTQSQACCVGPGLSTASESQSLVRQLVLDAQVPLIIDADGLNAFRGYAAMLRGLKHTAVLTPHDREWERLFRSPPGTGTARIAAVRAQAKEFSCVIVLKGTPTLVATPAGKVWMLPTANSGLAKAGSGDVLAGIIASLRAQGASAEDAALAGVWLHARAGLFGAESLGERSLLPSDLWQWLPQAFQSLSLLNLV
ncbi:MAG TPA: NAD(P)H-hydrate dehydratase [Fibrobacteraceae bacterium]|nr:NAD(P)H-hydrate dehydratase [Fibrobacteraceae bacterium]